MLNIQSEVFNGQCKQCQQNLKFEAISHSCVCDQSQGYVGSDPSQCQSCWDQQTIPVSGLCEPCHIGAIFSINKCICDESKGFTGINPNQCNDCFGAGLIVKDGECKTCQIGTRYYAGQCVCDESQGYVGNDPQICLSCWDKNQIIDSHGCKSCSNSAIFDQSSHSCKCDHVHGYAGQDSNNCQLCWSINSIVFQGACQSCGNGLTVVNNFSSATNHLVLLDPLRHNAQIVGIITKKLFRESVRYEPKVVSLILISAFVMRIKVLQVRIQTNVRIAGASQ
ncbi:Growth_factor receptor cysteine-rich domain superfamily [Hexamita inflata]|uniref:Growth factor receptor cysteine-rich domain superfamily n=1 Tax=Hexamita inflata TaxID=28002 RepID=A0AA86P1D4_9EUKA|nr:Growth factor receptor cysteine-rich domain superfamily [Hexamita inflata]